MINIVLADSQQMVRSGLKKLLESQPDFKLLGEAANGKEAIVLVQELKPDILIMDIMMDGLDGIDATRYITRNYNTKVIILSIHAARCYISEAMQVSAKAFILKQSSINELIDAIYQVQAGKTYFSPQIAELAKSCLQEAEVNAITPFTYLTGRERDVFYLLAQGFTNSEIARQLYISRRTAETHRSQIMRKLGLHHMVELVFYALRQGINRETIALGYTPGSNTKNSLKIFETQKTMSKISQELILERN